MEAEKWKRLKDLFDQALTFEGRARTEFIERTCAGDPAMQKDLTSLLHSHDVIPALLAEPALDWYRTEARDPGQLVGTAVGAWQITALIASGGMADVYSAVTAEGDSLAIKVIKFGLSSPEALQRFEIEGRTLAGLRHPNIVSLIGADVLPDGRSCLAMEFVAGETLDVYSAGHSLNEIIDIHIGICDAVQHAHNHLVVHRDLKPTNVIISEQGIPKVLDFGVVKLLTPDAEESATVTRHIAPMTPRYASPEQLRGESISTSSDIYMLGVLLRESIERFELPPRHDLGRIVSMACDDDPRLRYASSEALQSDLGSYLRNEPVRAHRGTWRYRTGRFVARNRWSVACTATLMLALLTTLGFLYGQWQRARLAEGLGWQAHGQALQVSQFFHRLVLSTDPTSFAEDTGMLAVLDRESSTVGATLAGHPEAEARVRISIARLYMHIDRPRDALPHAEAALEISLTNGGFGSSERIHIRELVESIQARTGR